MTSAAEFTAAGQIGDVLLWARGCEVAVVVGEADDFIGVADVNPLRVGSKWIEGDAEGLVEIGGEDGDLLWLAVGIDAAKDFDFAAGAVSEEEIAVGSEADESWVVEAGRVKLDLEPFGRDRPRAFGAGNDGRAVVEPIGQAWVRADRQRSGGGEFREPREQRR